MDGLECLDHLQTAVDLLGLPCLQILDGALLVVNNLLSHQVQQRLGTSGGLLQVGAPLVRVTYPAALGVQVGTLAD